MNGRVNICDCPSDEVYLTPQGSALDRALDQAGCCDKIINEPRTKSVETCIYDYGKKRVLPWLDTETLFSITRNAAENSQRRQTCSSYLRYIPNSSA
jgi:hypothetical protein